MSSQHPMILFVGSAQQARDLLAMVEPVGWWVYPAETPNEALGMYVSYLPDVIVLNADTLPEVAEEVYYHLASVEADPLIVIGGHSQWSDRVVYHLPANAKLTEIIGCAAEATDAEWLPETT